MNIRKKASTYIFPLMSLTLVLALLFNPAVSIGAAKSGLLLWFNTVLPSLLPFIIGANILMASGSVYFFKKIFSPIMKPLFKVPVCCAFPWIMGLISGYPMGAKTAAELYKNKQISPLEMQRLLCFCNNSGPFFILGAVGIGMLSDQQLGYFLLAIHLVSSILVGISFRFYGNQSGPGSIPYMSEFKPSHSIGDALGMSIMNSMEVILHIGGYIIIFSVIGTLIKETTIIKWLASSIYFLFKPLGITRDLAISWLLATIEMSNGAHLVATSHGPQRLTLAMISFILGWGGLSIHAQSLNFMKNIPIKTSLYLLAKFIHGVIAFILTVVLFPLYVYYHEQSIPVLALTYTKTLPLMGFTFIIGALIMSVFATQLHQK